MIVLRIRVSSSLEGVNPPHASWVLPDWNNRLVFKCQWFISSLCSVNGPFRRIYNILFVANNKHYHLFQSVLGTMNTWTHKWRHPAWTNESILLFFSQKVITLLPKQGIYSKQHSTLFFWRNRCNPRKLWVKKLQYRDLRKGQMIKNHENTLQVFCFSLEIHMKYCHLLLE